MNNGKPKNHVREVALETFNRFRRAAAGGGWEEFLAMLTEDFTFWEPIAGEFNGENKGRELAERFYREISANLTVEIPEPYRVSSNGETVVIEYEEHGTLAGKPFDNRVAISYDVRGDKVCASREYLGDVTPLVTDGKKQNSTVSSGRNKLEKAQDETKSEQSGEKNRLTKPNSTERTVSDNLYYLSVNDLESWIDLWHEDGIYELPFAPPGTPTLVQGRANVKQYMQLVLSAMRPVPGESKHWLFSDLKIYPTDEPETVIAEYHGQSQIALTDRIYRQRYIARVTTRDGKIALYREHWNPLIFLEALGSLETAQDAFAPMNHP